MYENQLTPRAQGALRRAHQAAEELGHSYVGSEHLLLGLALEESGSAGGACWSRPSPPTGSGRSS